MESIAINSVALSISKIPSKSIYTLLYGLKKYWGVFTNRVQYVYHCSRWYVKNCYRVYLPTFVGGGVACFYVKCIETILEFKIMYAIVGSDTILKISVGRPVELCCCTAIKCDNLNRINVANNTIGSLNVEINVIWSNVYGFGFEVAQHTNCILNGLFYHICSSLSKVDCSIYKIRNYFCTVKIPSCFISTFALIANCNSNCITSC